MTDRNIRYCTTEDGVHIAYCVEGAGATTIIAIPALFETFSLDHMMPVYRQFYRDLGAGRRVIRFDRRGCGLSDAVSQFPDRFALLDLEAVACSAGADKYVIWAPTTAGSEAIAFSAKHPDLVSHLVFCGSFAALSDALSQDLLQGLEDLAKASWEMATRTIADMNGRREFPDEAASLGEWYRLSMSAQSYAAWTNARLPDARDLFPKLQAPTLVLHRINDPAIPFSAGQKLAAGIPKARLVPLQGKGHLFCLGDYTSIIAAVDAFLGDRECANVDDATMRASSAFRTVLFTDLVGHTEMMSRLGDVHGRDVLREHERITRETLAAHEGSELKAMGDGFMASFRSVAKAVECAIALQNAFADRNASAAEPLRVRVGLNAGEPIEEEGDLFGATVILAARVAASAEGGQILVADTVRGLCSGKGFCFADHGDILAKGFNEPVRVSEVRWAE